MDNLNKLSDEADLFLRDGDYQAAIARLLTILEISPGYDEFGDIYQDVAICFEGLGEFAKADEYFSISIHRAKGANPQELFHRNRYGLFLKNHGDPKLAFDELINAHRLLRQQGFTEEVLPDLRNNLLEIGHSLQMTESDVLRYLDE